MIDDLARPAGTDAQPSIMVDRLSCFGLGKLGLPLAALFARSGLRTIGIDIDATLIGRLQTGAIRHDEPGLDEILIEAGSNIVFTTDAREAVDTDASIILVPTPSDANHPEFSSAQVEQACKDLCAALKARPVWRYHLVIISSTVMPRAISTTIISILEDGLGRRAGRDFGIAYVPDFVALGQVIGDFQRPPFLLIGRDEEQAGARTAALFRRIVAPETPIRLLSIRDAELAKIASNIFLCMKISFGNLLSQLSDRLGGGDLDAIASTLSLDPRIGVGFLRAGSPYGGTCLPRDVDAFVQLAQSAGLEAPLASASRDINAAQYDLIERHLLAGHPRCVALLGLAFKPGTSVTIGSPAFEFARRLASRSIRLVAFDPKPRARESAQAEFGPAITCHNSLAGCLASAEAVLICNADPAFAEIVGMVAADRRIIDPWGCVRGQHPGLVRIGRLANSATEGRAVRLQTSATIGTS